MNFWGKELIDFKKTQTTNLIAILIICTFILAMIFIGVKIVYSDSISTGDGKEWFSLFKNGFIVFGNLLTALVGYYFGSRSGEAALEKASDIYDEAKNIDKNVAELSPTIEDETRGIEDIKPENIK